MGREKLMYYDDELYEMLPSSKSSFLPDIRWNKNNNSDIDDAESEAGSSPLWNEDFSHRPSWCDAKLALKQIKNGKAEGNKPALYLRAGLQHILFRLGCFIQRRSSEVLFLGVLILCLFSVGLRNATIETNMEKLWVEKGGQLDEERQFVRRAFSVAGSRPDDDGGGFTATGNGNSVQYLVLIQTPRKTGSDILNEDELLLHEKILANISQMSIQMYGENWTLSDICFSPAAPTMPGKMKEYFQHFLDKIIPCVIITPLDCFWEGSKPNGPFPPVDIPDSLLFFIEKIRPQETWKTLDPITVLEEIREIMGKEIKEIEMVGSLFARAGIKHGYVDRPCIDPLDPECPKTAPNYVDVCPVVEKFIKYNNEHGRIYNLTKKFNGASENLSRHRRSVNESDSETNNGTTSIVLVDQKALDEENCETYKDQVRKILRADRKLARLFLPSNATANFARELTNGCTGFAENYMQWPEDLIVGGVQRDHGKIIKAEALQSVFMVASAQDVYNRVKFDEKKNLAENRKLWTLEAAENVVNAWQRNFTSYVYDNVNNTDDDGVRQLHPLAGTSVNDMLKEFSHFNPTVIIIGYVFMLIYSSLSLCSCAESGVRSGVGLGLAGCLLVTFAGIAGLGCSMLFGISFNAATTQIVPFLTLGLGVDDMFLLVHNYKDIVKYVSHNEMGFLLKETGLSALLTSLNNIMAFLAGGLMPVPALRDFCLQVAILLCFNAVSILTLYPAMMSFDLIRRKSKRVDIFCCIKVDQDKVRPREPSNHSHSNSNHHDLAKTNSQCGYPPPTYDEFVSTQSINGVACPMDKSGSNRYLTSVQRSSGLRSRCGLQHWTLHRFVKDYYVKWLCKMPVKVFIVCFHLAILGFGIVGCTQVTLGLELTDVIPKGTAAYSFLDARDDYFSFYPMSAVLKGPMDIARKQKLAREYREALGKISYVVKKGGKVNEQFWLKSFENWLTNLQKLFDEDWEKKLFRLDNGTVYSNGSSADAILAYKMFCNKGDVVDCTNVGRERFVDDDGIINVDGFYNYLTAWFNYDPLTYYVSQANMNPEPINWIFDENITTPANFKVPPSKDPMYSQIPFFLNHITDTPATVDMIRKVRAVCDKFTADGLPNFPDGIAFTFWEQYLHLRWNLIVALLIVIGSVFVVITILLMSPWTAAIVAVVLVMLVVELAGFMGIFGLKLNAVSAVTLITAVGIGVEFTVHVSLSYLTAMGSRNERMARTLDHMFIPVLHGGLSTLLGVIMLAFSEFEFIVHYFFLVMSALIVLGLVNGLLLLPVLLSLIGPRSEVRATDGSNSLAPPTPPSKKKRANETATSFTPPINYHSHRGYQRQSDSLSTIAEENSQSNTSSTLVTLSPIQVVVHTGGGNSANTPTGTIVAQTKFIIGGDNNNSPTTDNRRRATLGGGAASSGLKPPQRHSNSSGNINNRKRHRSSPSTANGFVPLSNSISNSDSDSSSSTTSSTSRQSQSDSGISNNGDSASIGVGQGILNNSSSQHQLLTHRNRRSGSVNSTMADCKEHDDDL